MNITVKLQDDEVKEIIESEVARRITPTLPTKGYYKVTSYIGTITLQFEENEVVEEKPSVAFEPL